jgi:hypothetical protein
LEELALQPTKGEKPQRLFFLLREGGNAPPSDLIRLGLAIDRSGWGAAQANGVDDVLWDRSPKVLVDGSKVGAHVGCLVDADGSNEFGKSQEGAQCSGRLGIPVFDWLGHDVAVASEKQAFLGVEVGNFANELETFVGVERLGAAVVEMFVAEDPELVEGGKYQIDPVLDHGGGLIFVTRKFAEA